MLQNQDLFLTIDRIERYYQRRTAFLIHATLSLAFQVAMWANWYASYAAHGVGFEDNFFADRFIVSVVLLIFLLGHFALVNTWNSKDQLLMTALQQHKRDAEGEKSNR